MASKMQGLIAELRALPVKERAARLLKLSKAEVIALRYCWEAWARPEQLPPEGDWFIWLIFSGRGWGKDLALGTLIPTPAGYTTIGDVRVGDIVFDVNGLPTEVTYISPVHDDKDCYRVTFSDGAEVIASGDHEWVTWDQGGVYQTRCTTEILGHALPTIYVAGFDVPHIPPCPTDDYNFITAIELVNTVQTRCIEVASSTHQFLITESFIPTHNTRSGAEWLRHRVCNEGARRVALVTRTAADGRDVLVEGESGILSVFPPHQRPKYEPSKRRVTFHTGTVATLYSAESPDLLRGPQHDTALCDELAAWDNLEETWSNLLMGLRLGKPRVMITTTPRPLALLRELREDPRCVTTSGNTKDNIHNLSSTTVEYLYRKYEGSSLADQELSGVLLDEIPGALWDLDCIQRNRVESPPGGEMTVIGVDPATSAKGETGIVVSRLSNGQIYVLEDATVSGRPELWAKAVSAMYHKWKADIIRVESNQGGTMCSHVLRTEDESLKIAPTFSAVSKQERAAPVAQAYEHNRIHHVGTHRALEDQMVSWIPGEGKSPDRVDALVLGVTDLLQRSPLLWNTSGTGRGSLNKM